MALRDVCAATDPLSARMLPRGSHDRQRTQRSLLFEDIIIIISSALLRLIRPSSFERLTFKIKNIDTQSLFQVEYLGIHSY